jgi:hypothetical protein
MVIIAFDPGLNGGWVLWDTRSTDYRVRQVGTYPFTEDGGIDAESLALMLSAFSPCEPKAVVEKTLVVPGQGAGAAFTQGMNYANLLCAIQFSGFPFSQVAPITWTTWLHRHARRAKDSKKDTWAALQVLLSPEELAMIPRGPRSGKPHEGIMDAIGIALWAHNNSNKL